MTARGLLIDGAWVGAAGERETAEDAIVRIGLDALVAIPEGVPS